MIHLEDYEFQHIKGLAEITDIGVFQEGIVNLWDIIPGKCKIKNEVYNGARYAYNFDWRENEKEN